jgi:hypothetical protein
MQSAVCKGVVFALVVFDAVYVNKSAGSGAAGSPANPSDQVIRADCKLVRPFSTALDFFVSFFIKKKRKPRLGLSTTSIY